MKLTNQQIILTAQAIARVGYPDEKDLDAMVDVLEKLDQEINFSLDHGYRYHADNVVGEAQNDLEVQRCAINAEREEQERRMAEYEYELEPDGEDDD